MNLSEIKKVSIPRKRAIRVGRGCGSGKGKTCGKGMKGQNCRSGVTLPVVFEGGTMPLYRRIPKRGFNNDKFQEDWVCVNLKDLNSLEDGAEVTLASLMEAGIVNAPKSQKGYLKILGGGELKAKKLKIKAYKITNSAKKALEEAKADIEILKINKYRRPRRKR